MELLERIDWGAGTVCLLLCSCRKPIVEVVLRIAMILGFSQFLSLRDRFRCHCCSTPGLLFYGYTDC